MEGLGGGIRWRDQVEGQGMYNPEQENDLRKNWTVMCHRFARMVKCFCFIM